MEVEKLERLAISVSNLEEGMEKFSKMLGIEFEKVAEPSLPDGTKIRCAFSSKGVELVEMPGKEIGVRSFHFRVKDMDEAKEWVKKNGGKVLGQFSVGEMDEVPCNIFGLRIILVSYPGDDPIKAIEG